MCTGIECPCKGKWVNCSRYNSKIWGDIHPNQFNEQICEWYETRFRIQYEPVNAMGNG